MIYYLLNQDLNIVQYISFRAAGAAITALIISFLIGPKIIRTLNNHRFGEKIRKNGPELHLQKEGTPSMGGIIILLSIILPTILWAKLNNPFIIIILISIIWMGMIGFIDDYLKIKRNNSRGISSWMKIFCQIILSLIAVFLLIRYGNNEHLKNIYFPFVKNFALHLGLFFIPFAIFIIVGSSNAVNLTDGLDGLATVPVMLVALSFTLICYVVGNTVFSEYLHIPYIPNVGEASIFCGSIVGACLGFLWYNAPPAKIFMGDTGSLSLGGSLGAVSIITKHEIVLGIIGGLFVLETVSVIIQVISFKLTGKRVFMMAPLHHHFEKKGWAESTVVIRFWIISIILALVGLATLKLR